MDTVDHLAEHLDRIKGLDPELDLTVRLDETLASVCAMMPVDGAGLMVLDSGATLRYAAASNDTGRRLEHAQAESGVGPCVDALLNDEVTDTSDLAVDPRWPEIVDHLVPYGIRAVHGVPVHVGGMTIGSLNVYWGQPRTVEEHEAHALSAFTTVIEGVISAAILAHRRDRLVEQLQEALDSRIVIERAIGVLMGRHRIAPPEAFGRIRGAARSERRKALEVARDVCEGNVEL